MFALKNGVKDEGVHREIWYAIGIAEAVYAEFGAMLVVTSLTDGTHKNGSLHPSGRAVDFRVKNLSDKERMDAFERIKAKLEPLGFDVVPEGGVAGAADANTALTTGAHIHVEHDPKQGESFINFTA
ncbi:MAG: hypothetical protein JWO13_834 [Acidobacteriales bacterium]|nr:hypothetical protein [Terriglobales bacterium]